jgi:hypothetical protein
MNHLSRSLLCAFGLAAASLTGCATTDASAKKDGGACCAGGACAGDCSADTAATLSGANNEVCPLSGRPVDASVETVSFGGEEVGFCCAGCAGRFAGMTDAEKRATLGG